MFVEKSPPTPRPLPSEGRNGGGFGRKGPPGLSIRDCRLSTVVGRGFSDAGGGARDRRTILML